jgi:hypothetical protein
MIITLCWPWQKAGERSPAVLRKIAIGLEYLLFSRPRDRIEIQQENFQLLTSEWENRVE